MFGLDNILLLKTKDYHQEKIIEYKFLLCLVRLLEKGRSVGDHKIDKWCWVVVGGGMGGL